MPNCVHGIDVRFCAACANPADTTARRRRSIQMRAADRHPQTPAELKSYEAVYAYEEALSSQKGRTTRAGRTWPMIRKYGIIGAVERIVTRRKETEGYRVLVEMGWKTWRLRRLSRAIPSPLVLRRLRRRTTDCEDYGAESLNQARLSAFFRRFLSLERLAGIPGSSQFRRWQGTNSDALPVQIAKCGR